jgi:phosphoribosyl 1,2-cyclic phosphate phosphodiesterase
MILHTIGMQPFSIGDIPFTPIQVMHREMPVLGFRIGDFTYITDANFIAPAEQEKIKGSKVLILNALRPEPHPTHFTLQEALDMVNQLNVPEVYFTHFSHQIGLHEERSASLPKGVALAYDGMQFSI